MPNVRCPQCQAIVQVAAGEAPACTHCGFGSDSENPDAHVPHAPAAELDSPAAPAAPGALHPAAPQRARHPAAADHRTAGETPLEPEPTALQAIGPLGWVGLAIAAITLIVGLVGAL